MVFNFSVLKSCRARFKRSMQIRTLIWTFQAVFLCMIFYNVMVFVFGMAVCYRETALRYAMMFLLIFCVTETQWRRLILYRWAEICLASILLPGSVFENGLPKTGTQNTSALDVYWIWQESRHWWYLAISIIQQITHSNETVSWWTTCNWGSIY